MKRKRKYFNENKYFPFFKSLSNLKMFDPCTPYLRYSYSPGERMVKMDAKSSAMKRKFKHLKFKNVIKMFRETTDLLDKRRVGDLKREIIEFRKLKVSTVEVMKNK